MRARGIYFGDSRKPQTAFQSERCVQHIRNRSKNIGSPMDKIEIDSKALDYRIYVHDHFSKSDFDGWVINKLNLKKGLLVLDVGCGSGKHLFEIASKIGASGSVVGIDTSLESLRKCENKIKERNAKNISVLQCDLSEIGD